MSSSKPKPWPHNAAWARDDSAELADDIQRKLGTLIENWYALDELTKMQVIAIAMKNAQTITRKLESVGANTRP